MLITCGRLVGWRVRMRAGFGGGKRNRGRRRKNGSGGCCERGITLMELIKVQDAFQDRRIMASTAKVWISYGGELHQHKSSP